MNGGRVKAGRLLADPDLMTAVVEHKDRLGWMNVEILTSFCARLYGRFREEPGGQSPGSGGQR